MPVNTGYISNLTADWQSHMSMRSPVRMFSTLSVDGATTFNGGQVMASTLSVGGAARFGSTLSVDGATTMQGALTLNAALASASAISGGAGTFTQVSLTSNDFASVNTVANASSMTRGELRLVFQASGISLIFSSGASVYVVGQSSQSAAQA